jgi:hypothetical protein
MSKALYTVKPFKLELMVMEPEVVEVPSSGIEQYEANKIGETYPENEAWLEVKGNYYAVGFLASSRFYGDGAIRELKYERAVYKVLAMVGALAVRKQLPSEFSLGLGILLPIGEYNDRSRLEALLLEALSNFTFRSKRYRVSLKGFNCMPEGAGVFLRGLDYRVNPKEKTILVVIAGYRNASYLLMERGRIGRGETEELGFVRLLEKAIESTSGLKSEEMLAPICEAGVRVKSEPLRSLVKSREPKLQKAELHQIVWAVRQARSQYWQMLANWLASRKFPKLDEVIVTGGTANYYRSELSNFFAPYRLNWGDHLEQEVVELVGHQRWSQEFAYRLTDVCGYFYYLQYALKKQELKAVL